MVGKPLLTSTDLHKSQEEFVPILFIETQNSFLAAALKLETSAPYTDFL